MLISNANIVTSSGILISIISNSKTTSHVFISVNYNDSISPSHVVINMVVTVRHARS